VTRNLKRVPHFHRDHPEYTQGQTRWWIFNAPTNGMVQHGVVVRIGRTVWIDEDAFFRWIDAQQEAAA
jgi:hypothetical protein